MTDIVHSTPYQYEDGKGQLSIQAAILLSKIFGASREKMGGVKVQILELLIILGELTTSVASETLHIDIKTARDILNLLAALEVVQVRRVQRLTIYRFSTDNPNSQKIIQTLRIWSDGGTKAKSNTNIREIT